MPKKISQICDVNVLFRRNTGKQNISKDKASTEIPDKTKDGAQRRFKKQLFLETFENS